MTTAASRTTPAPRTSRLAGYLLALGAGATWGTTGPLSTGLYGLMPATSIGFWRVLLGTACLAAWGLAFRRDLFRVDARGWLLPTSSPSRARAWLAPPPCCTRRR